MDSVRLVQPEDAERLAEIHRENREFLQPSEPERPDIYFTVEGQAQKLEVELTEYAAGRAYPLVVLSADRQVIGRLNLSGITRGAFQSASMGYWIASEFNGMGLATRAVSDVLRIAFGPLKLHRVQAETLVANTASRRVLQKNGFQEIGFAPEYLKIAGRWQDHILFQRLAEQ